MESIVLSKVTFTYDNELIILKDVDLTVNEGDFLVVLGPNGSGKSTLAKLMNGLLLPTSGTVTVYGMPTFDEDRLFDIRSSVGMVFQNPDNQMIAGIIEDDIAFGPENLGMPREEIIKNVDWALNAVDMAEHRKDTPFKMSGGQKQRIAIAAMLAMKPKVLVLDESTAMLDPSGRKKIMDVLTHLNKDENMTVILITHYMDEVLYGSRTVVLYDGEIVADSTPEKLFNSGMDLRKYEIRQPVVTELAGKLIANGVPVDMTLSKEKLAEELCRLLR